mmetsp:Transcript_4259/g.9146  ORF Transcript_4259/g.9146 Transcript_4259/m.9146 type:complete len:299 (+) Transcript_4259:1518-2414(+)
MLRQQPHAHEEVLQVVVRRRHVQLHLQRVEDLHLGEHQLLESVGVVADEDEVVHVGDHHLLVLARQAERADPDQLQPLARHGRRHHVAPHKVDRELDRARDELELVAHDREPVHQDGPHARVELRLARQEGRARLPCLVRAQREEARRRRRRRRQVRGDDRALLVDVAKVRVLQRLGGGDALGGLGAHQLAQQVASVLAQHGHGRLQRALLHCLKLLDHHVHVGVAVTARNLGVNGAQRPQVVGGAVALAFVLGVQLWRRAAWADRQLLVAQRGGGRREAKVGQLEEVLALARVERAR